MRVVVPKSMWGFEIPGEWSAVCILRKNASLRCRNKNIRLGSDRKSLLDPRMICPCGSALPAIVWFHDDNGVDFQR
jgi:hypothetical protein